MNRNKLFEKVDIYPVTCEALSRGRSDLFVLKELISAGTRIIQLREKGYTKRELYNLAVEFRRITGRHGVLLIINDHVDVALMVKADGVHLGQEDLPFAAARKLAPKLLIGISVHNLLEARAAERGGADYINVGPIFKTSTKDEEPIGLKAFKLISSKVKIPITVMGGINEDRLPQVLKAGARKIALISALTKAPDIGRAFKRIRKQIEAASSH